ncbi:hypothetical protein JHK86_055696 [Glycine max]|nr:hypothetical protein JHK86_055696 [Glycine max]
MQARGLDGSWGLGMKELLSAMGGKAKNEEATECCIVLHGTTHISPLQMQGVPLAEQGEGSSGGVSLARPKWREQMIDRGLEPGGRYLNHGGR